MIGYVKDICNIEVAYLCVCASVVVGYLLSVNVRLNKVSLEFGNIFLETLIQYQLVQIASHKSEVPSSPTNVIVISG